MDTTLIRICDTIITKTSSDNISPTESNVFGLFPIIVVCIFVAVCVFQIIDLIKKSKISKQNIASENLGRQIFGALIQWHPKSFWTFVLLLTPLSIGISLILSPHDFVHCLELIGLNLVVWLTVKVCRRLIAVLNLRKKDTRVTWCYITILAAIGLWLICFVLIFDIKANGKVAAAIGIIGGVLGWIFQDKVKGVVAFFHLRMHHLLKVGDWLKVDKLGVDGEVQRMTLTSVTIYNWDTTTSTIPISALQSEHFVNLQNMMEGKTYGRKMSKTFVLDTSWFRTLSKYEVEQLIAKVLRMENDNQPCGEKEQDSLAKNLSAEEIKDGVLNAQLYRLYIHHWLMNHPHISQQPRLIVRWMDQKDGGMPLQIYAFITDSSLAPFEWQQSQIIEHIIKSMDWFGLRLYQSPSAFDVSNNNIYLTSRPAKYRKEVKYE